MEMEECLKEMLEGGYIAQDGTPLKCPNCEYTEFKQVNKYHGESYLEEYSLECTNGECLAIVGTWSYGCWMF